MMISLDILFSGAWHFKRQVRGLMPESLELQGQATFTPQVLERRLYEEEGSYTQNQQEIDFHGCYLYEVLAPQHCRVLFPDGHLFYELSKSAQDIEHQCGEDHYQGHFECHFPEEWQLDWRIKGPRKDLWITTLYKRPKEV